MIMMPPLSRPFSTLMASFKTATLYNKYRRRLPNTPWADWYGLSDHLDVR